MWLPSGGGIKNGRIRYTSYRGTQKRKEKRNPCLSNRLLHVVGYDADELPDSLLVAAGTLQAQDQVVAAAQVHRDQLVRLLRHAHPGHLQGQQQVIYLFIY